MENTSDTVIAQADAARSDNARRSFNASRLALVVALLMASGLFLINQFSSAELDREMNSWQVKLNLIADSRVSEVNNWVKSQFGELQALADNASLQIYVTELEGNSTEADKSPPAEQIYLRNLLIFTARNAGFGAKDDAVRQIQANVRKLGLGGIAVIDNAGKVLVSTPDMPSLEGEVLKKLQAQEFGKSALMDMERNPTGQLQMGFVMPVFSIQGDRDASSQVARVVGIKTIDDDLFSRLVHPGVTEKTIEAFLVRSAGDNVVNLSPLKDGSKPLEKTISRSSAKVDMSAGITKTGTFIEAEDINGRSVLMTSRSVAGAPWTLIARIDSKEALRDGNAFRTRTTIILFLAMALLIAIIGAAWWYGTSRRAIQYSDLSNKLAAQYAAKEKLLRLVTDNQPEPIFITDRFSKIWFVNEKAAHAMNAPASELIGKELANVMGPALAQDYMDASKSALELDRTVSRTLRHYEESEARIIRSEHIPLSHIPMDALPYPTAGVLVVDQDITEVVQEREKRAMILRQIVDTLVKMVDQRDPYSANHSAMVVKVAREMASGMGLDSRIIETTDIAGNLMNIGKIVVPTETLTKTASLNDNELSNVRRSLQQSADVLAGIDFDGPVVETLRQAQEHFDGAGPSKLKGEDILISARIIAVANAFVGMISPRSYRAAMPIDKALKILLEEIEVQFDRKVVVALVNYIENKGGKQELANLEINKAA